MRGIKFTRGICFKKKLNYRKFVFFNEVEEMSTFNWIEAIYGSMGLAMILLYIPQIKILAQASTAITSMSAPTWGFWSFGYLTHFLYGYSKLEDMKFCLLSLLIFQLRQ